MQERNHVWEDDDEDEDEYELEIPGLAPFEIAETFGLAAEYSQRLGGRFFLPGRPGGSVLL
jgi:hypothetical protein